MTQTTLQCNLLPFHRSSHHSLHCFAFLLSSFFFLLSSFFFLLSSCCIASFVVLQVMLQNKTIPDYFASPEAKGIRQRLETHAQALTTAHAGLKGKAEFASDAAFTQENKKRSNQHQQQQRGVGVHQSSQRRLSEDAEGPGMISPSKMLNAGEDVREASVRVAQTRRSVGSNDDDVSLQSDDLNNSNAGRKHDSLSSNADDDRPPVLHSTLSTKELREELGVIAPSDSGDNNDDDDGSANGDDAHHGARASAEETVLTTAPTSVPDSSAAPARQPQQPQQQQQQQEGDGEGGDGHHKRTSTESPRVFSSPVPPAHKASQRMRALEFLRDSGEDEPQVVTPTLSVLNAANADLPEGSQANNVFFGDNSHTHAHTHQQHQHQHQQRHTQREVEDRESPEPLLRRRSSDATTNATTTGGARPGSGRALPEVRVRSAQTLQSTVPQELLEARQRAPLREVVPPSLARPDPLPAIGTAG